MIDKIFKPILWEYNLESLSYEDDIVFVKTLMFGDKEHIDVLKRFYGREGFKQKFIKLAWKLDKKTANYWAKIFDLDLSQILKNKPRTINERINQPVFERSFESSETKTPTRAKED